MHFVINEIDIIKILNDMYKVKTLKVAIQALRVGGRFQEPQQGHSFHRFDPYSLVCDYTFPKWPTFLQTPLLSCEAPPVSPSLAFAIDPLVFVKHRQALPVVNEAYS